MVKYMSIAEFSFANLRIWPNGIVEVKVFEGVKLDLSHIVELQNYIDHNISSYFGLLINRQNRYEHSASSFQQTLKWSPKLKAMAVVYQLRVDQYLQEINEEIYGLKSNIEIEHFENYGDAFCWLEAKLSSEK